MAIIRLKKLFEDNENLWFDAIVISAGQSLPIKNWRGFTVAEIEEDGTIKSKGRQVKT